MKEVKTRTPRVVVTLEVTSGIYSSLMGKVDGRDIEMGRGDKKCRK